MKKNTIKILPIEKENKNLTEEIKELKEDREIVFKMISELYDIIEEWETDMNFILSELASIQNFSK